MSEYWDTLCVLKLYTREADSERVLKLLERLEMDEANGKLRFIELGREVLKRSEQVGRACLRGGRGILLRTLDGLHLGTAIHCGCKTIVTADERMQAGARKMGLKVVP